MTAPMTSIRRRRRLVGWSARFELLAGGRAATWFVGNRVFLDEHKLFTVRKQLERTGDKRHPGETFRWSARNFMI